MTQRSQQKKILVIGPSWVGDMVMAQTLFMRLKQNDPTCTIDVFAPAASRPVLSRMPEVRHAIPSPFSHGELNIRGRYEVGKDLRAEAYDQAIVLPNSYKSALVPFFANIPLRTGWRGEMRWGMLNDIRKLNKAELPLMIERFVALSHPAGALLQKPLPTPALQIDQANVDAVLSRHGLNRPRSPLLILCPGAEYGSAKRWPPVYFATLAKEKVSEGWAVWIFGGKKDQSLGHEIQTLSGRVCEDLTGRTKLDEAIDLMSLGTIVVSNDSGLMHIAAAVARPLIAIYGSSSPAFTPPLGERVTIISEELPCSPCFKRECPQQHFRCMTELRPPRVLEAIKNLEVVCEF